MEEIRAFILSQSIERMGGENITRLRGKDIRFIFEMYDKLVFKSQISYHLQGKKAKMRFRASSRISGLESLCGIQSSTPLVYYLDLAPKVLKKRTMSYLTNVIEDQMINLVLLCWDLILKRSSKRLIHYKLMNKYFGRDPISKCVISVDSEVPSSYPVPIGNSLGFFLYSDNSCYLDSLLTVLLFAEPDFFRKRLLDSNPKQFKYSNPKVLTRGQGELTQKQIIKLTTTLQSTLLKDYTKLTRGSFLTSNPIRAQLTKFYSDLQVGKTYNVSAVYDLLTEIFPDLKIKNVPVVVNSKVSLKKLTMFQFRDYTTKESAGERIQWSKISSPILVFQNSGTSECGAFKETILEGRYRLFGAIILHGIRPGEDGGIHYTLYFRQKGGQWCHYNDIGPSMVRLPHCPNVFIEKNGSKPEMYFYIKTSPSILIEKIERPGRRTIILAKDKGCLEKERAEVLKLSPRTKNPKTWLWILPPKEANQVCDRLREISCI